MCLRHKQKQAKQILRHKQTPNARGKAQLSWPKRWFSLTTRKKTYVLAVGEVWGKKPQRTKVFKNNQLLLNIIVIMEHIHNVRHYSKYFMCENSSDSPNSTRGSAISLIFQMWKNWSTGKLSDLLKVILPVMRELRGDKAGGLCPESKILPILLYRLYDEILCNKCLLNTYDITALQ